MPRSAAHRNYSFFTIHYSFFIISKKRGGERPPPRFVIEYIYMERSLFAAFFVQHSLHLNRQAEQVDKAACVLLVIDMVLREGRDFLIIEGVRRGDARVDDVALVELELDVAGDSFGGLVDESGEGLPERGVPLAVVDEVGELQRDLLFIVLGLLVQADGFQHVMGVVEDGAAGSFVNASGLHAD